MSNFSGFEEKSNLNVIESCVDFKIAEEQLLENGYFILSGLQQEWQGKLLFLQFKLGYNVSIDLSDV